MGDLGDVLVADAHRAGGVDHPAFPVEVETEGLPHRAPLPEETDGLRGQPAAAGHLLGRTNTVEEHIGSLDLFEQLPDAGLRLDGQDRLLPQVVGDVQEAVLGP